MAGIVLSIASKLAEYLVAPVGHQCGYVIFSNSYVGQLKEELEKLDYAKDGVKHSIDDALNNMKKIKREVDRWKNDAETIANKARGLVDNDVRAKQTCFWGWLPNPKERYCLGRDARKTFQAIQDLITHSKFERVYYESAPPGHVAGTPDVNSSAGDGGDTIDDSRVSIFQDIMKALDDEKLKVIGVYGPGGVGKTTLLEEVVKKLKKERRPFNTIVKAIVSQTPDLKKIQDDIAYAVGLKLKDEPSEVGRRDLLCQRLQRDPSEKVLIILDDLWDKLDLKAVGIPSGDESRGCKLLLTSRFKDVLEQNMLACPTFRLEGLNNDEAFRLFEKMVGDKLKDEEFKAIAPQVVKKLAGLPLLIISVASTLKDRDVYAWRNALRKLDEPNIGTIVKLSYEHLKSEDAKSLFLLCGLIGGTIQVETLLVLGMGLGLFEEFDTVQDSRDRLNTVLIELRSACLLPDGGDDEDNVTIHDLYRERAVSTPFRGQNFLMMTSNTGWWSKEKLEKCWAICQVNVGSDRLAELVWWACPELKILMLSQPKNWNGRAAHRHDEGDCCRLDFTYMKELRVLYLCSMHITTLPSSIAFLENLRSLYLDHCDVGDVAILGKLKALQILSFAGSKISKLPKEIGELTDLRSLNLSNCEELQTIESGVLKRLIKLEELHMKGSFDRWTGKDEIPSELCNVGLAELKSLKKIAYLEISIRDPTKLSEDDDLAFENLSRFWINIGNANGRTFGGLRTMKLKLNGCDSILSREWLQKTPQNTQYLHLDGLKEFKKNTHELYTQRFLELKHLDIDNSPSIKYIADSSDGLPLTAFTILESLFLKNLINLEKICNGPVAPECFSKLKAVSIEECHRLKNLWFLSEMQRLVYLEELQVHECNSMQAIVTGDVGKVKVAANDIVELPNVCRLDLRALPKMASFCTGAEGAPIQVSLPRLESLVMVGLLGLEEILFSEPSFKCSNLKSLEIEESKSTSKSILKLDWILKMPNLESLKIESSPSAEVVFDMEEHLDIDNSPSIKYIANSSDGLRLTAFTVLESLFLKNLTNLEKICNSPFAPECFSKLKAMSIEQCHRLKNLWFLSEKQRLVHLEELQVRECDSLQAIITDVAGTDDIVELPNVRSLDLCALPKMTSFCTGAEGAPIQVSLPCLESLVMVGLLGLEEILFSEPSFKYGNLKSLEIEESKSTSKSILKLDWILKLPNLESMKIYSSPSAEVVFDLEELKVTKDVEILIRLTTLELSKFPNLRCMWKQNLQLQGIPRFRNLEKIYVYKTGLSFLFPESVAKCLRKIRVIKAEDCPNMKAVIVDEEGRDEGTDDITEFPLLKNLIIMHCPTEKFFSYPDGNKEPVTTASDSQDAYSESFFDQKVSLPSLEFLCLDSIGSFKRIWHDELPRSSFCKLTTLILENCYELLNVFPSTIIKRLHNLKKVEVSNSLPLESLFDCGSFDSNTERKIVSLPKLERVEVSGARRLEHMVKSNSHTVLGFPSLTKVEVKNCSELRYLFPNYTATTLGKLKGLWISKCERMKEVVHKEEGGQSEPETKEVVPKEEGGQSKLETKEVVRKEEGGQSEPETKEVVRKEEGGQSEPETKEVVHKEEGGQSKLETKEVVHKEEGGQSEPETKEVVRKEEGGQPKPETKEVVPKEGGQSKPEVMSFPSLDYLRISQCHNFGVFIWSPTSVERPSGEMTKVDDELPQAFFNEMARFPNIKSLDIEGAQCKELWNNQIPIDSFRKLKSLELKHCDNLQRIAPSRMWKRLQRNLETLTVDSCHSIEIIFESDAYAEKNGNMRRLILWNLAKLRHIWQYDGLPKGGEIRDIEVMDCPNMEAVVVDEEGRGEGIDDIVEFPQLESLCIFRCPTDKFFSYPHGKKESITTTSDSQGAYSNPFFDPKVSLPSLETLDLYSVGSFKRIWHGELPKNSFDELATLSLGYCSDLLNVFPSTIIGRLRNLKSVKIINCPSVESLFDCGSLDANTEQTTELLPKLEEVEVWEARKLRSLVKSDSQMIWGFPSLKVVSVANCSDMKYLFPNFTATRLEKLERIDIRQCEQMKEVVPEEEGRRSKADVISFPSLRHLRILQCPNFGAFIRSPTSVKRQSGETAKKNDESPQPLFNEMVTFPNIRELEIEGIQCQELWNNQSPTNSFCKLESLGLKNCDNLQRIASSHMWKRLQRCLEILQVISCHSIKIIYEGDGSNTKSSKLRRLVLHDLKNLRHIWQSDGLPNIPFPNLRYVEAVRCSRLEMLFATFTAEFLGQIEELVVELCGNMELIAGHEKWEGATGTTTITFSKLTALRLFELPKFRSFLPEKYPLKFPYSEDFPSLRDLSIASCGAEPDRVTVDWESHRRPRNRWPLEQPPRIRRLANIE